VNIFDIFDHFTSPAAGLYKKIFYLFVFEQFPAKYAKSDNYAFFK
jgi:hypothetical protein